LADDIPTHPAVRLGGIVPSLKFVLCYGDSNTWGTATVERPDGRYGPHERWPGVLREALGSGWLVIEEGLAGRTTVNDDPVEGAERNGRTYLYPCLLSHRPLDVAVIMLGTNDLKARFNKSAWEVAAGVGVLVEMVKAAKVGRGEGVPEIVVVCPPRVRDELPSHADLFAGAPLKSRELARHYQRVATETGVRFFDAGTVVQSSEIDGFHLDPDAHAVLGRAIAAQIAQLPVADSKPSVPGGTRP
jgi:lysophospholipase L1-like esterase